MSDNITIKIVDDKFATGKYLTFEIKIMRENGYINASNIALQHNKKVDRLKAEGIDTEEVKKKFNSWATRKKNVSYMKFLVRKLGLDSISDLMYEQEDGNKEFLGTYIHRKLIVEFCEWVSHEFKYRVQEIIDAYVEKETKAIVDKQNKLLEEKEEKIDELLREVKESRKENKKYSDLNKYLHLKNKKTMKQLFLKCRDGNPKPKNPKKRHIFAIVQLFSDTSIYFDQYMQFKMVRRARETYLDAIAEIKVEWANAKVIIKIADVPNAVDMGNLLKEYSKDNLKFKGLYFDLTPTQDNDYYDVEDLRETVQEVDDLKYELADIDTDDESDSGDESD